ncbi:hypothetical protein AVEN_59761-1 [Araneus ventricosus]|uniref:Uncharacterized protein n=1 Tax=Araneus ventricosus TaxID=182803 RepID=A0A4Y2V3G8_ARAVE|nr:hypothetical protein AVEN_59761-1 [Araneus ventricosus]
MSSSSLSEEDALEYDMSEDLEDSPAVNSPPLSSKPEKANRRISDDRPSGGISSETSFQIACAWPLRTSLLPPGRRNLELF